MKKELFEFPQKHNNAILYSGKDKSSITFKGKKIQKCNSFWRKSKTDKKVKIFWGELAFQLKCMYSEV